jgi:tetratricopeptide (TPR) repeat protein
MSTAFTAPPAGAAPAPYDAFISYSHAKDKPVAAALQAVMQKLGKSWHQRRALRIFRDDTSLAATPELWLTIEQGLARARSRSVVASPQFAASEWCGKEVAYWLEHKSVDTLLIALTEGELTWCNATRDFTWSGVTPLPQTLRGKFRSEPKWVDLRAHRASPNARDARLADAAADLAAAVHGQPKEDLLSREVRQQRRALSLAWSAAAVLLLLSGVAFGLAGYALHQRNRAELALDAATRGADSLVREVVIRIRNRSGVPVDLVREILDRARELQRMLADNGVTSPALRRSVAVTLREMATTLLNQNEVEAALEAAQQSLKIMLELFARDGADAALRRELSVTHNRIGEAYAKLGRHEEALESFQEAHKLRKELVGPEAASAPWQRDLATSHERIGDALLALRRFDEALAEFRLAFALREKLVREDPDSAELRGHLSVSYEKIGDIQMEFGQIEEALANFRQSLAIREGLAATDTKAQNDLAASHTRIGDALLRRGHKQAAVDSYREALAIRDRLLRDDPNNVQWQRGVVVALVKLAEAGDDPRARLTRAMDIARRLAAEGRLPGDMQRWPDELARRLAQLPAE